MQPWTQPITLAFLRMLSEIGIGSQLTSTSRDVVTQQRLWDCYQRTGCNDCRSQKGQRSCLPAAPPGQGSHPRGLAFDVRFTPHNPEAYRLAGELWEAMGFTWGGRFDDPVHFDFRRRA